MPDGRPFTQLLDGRFHVRRAEARDEAIAALAADQRGITGRSQLIDLGISSRAVDGRLRRGTLRLKYPGVYAVGHDALPFSAKVLAAVMSCSPNAAVSHWTLAALLQLCEPRGSIHVTAAERRVPRRGLVIHRAALPPGDLTVVEGIPATTVERMLLDLSAGARAKTIRRLVKRAQFLDLTTAEALAAVLDRHPRRRGRGNLAQLVDGFILEAGKTRSEFEDLFLEFCADRGLPLPATNVVIDVRGRPEVDCVWPEARLVVELDSRSAHEREVAFHDDRARDRALIAGGWSPMRVTWAQFRLEADTVEHDIRVALSLGPAHPRQIAHPGGG